MQLVIDYHHKPATTSVRVAGKFGKNHKDVLDAIRQLACSQSFRERNFTLSSYKTAQNKTAPMYIIGRDGFTMLVMSFTGAKAAAFREEFIDEFNRMEEVLRQGVTPSLIPTYQNRILSEPTKNCPETHWSIFDQAHPIMLFVEKHIGSVNEYDLVDGSIGSHWAKYRKDKKWAGEASTFMYVHKDVRGARECKCYPYSELQHFKKWLKDSYKPLHLLDYLCGKYSRDKNQVMLDKVNELLPKLLES
ncbi:MAG TPA: Rha family transcriptional regulator [Puia sp.]|nr:Rha family transcriptional regulator [Puia sp.]